MARQLRIEYEGAWYHIMNRGAARQTVFFTDEHREIFLQLLLEIHRRFQIEIHAYCLMGNHYHLLIRTPLANLSKAMRRLNSLYVRRLNKLLKRDGPLFRNRFKSIIVDSENYLLRVSRYIHLNPVKAGLVKKAEMYPWSSYAYYINSKTASDWLFCKETLNRFAGKFRYKQYQIFVEEGVDNETDTFYKKIKRVPILGAEAFTKTISEKYLKDQPDDREIPQQNLIINKQRPTIELVFQAVAKNYELEMKELLKVMCRKKNIARSMAVYLSIDYAQASQKEVANFFGTKSYWAISKSYTRFRRMIDEDKVLANRASLILQML